MRISTPTKLKLLKKFIDREFPIWKSIHGHNLEGVHIGYKETDGKLIRRYSIKFHVKKKYSKPSKPFPKLIDVDIDGQILEGVPTDVLESGRFELDGTSLGQKIKPKGNYGYGSLGFFGTRNGHSYLCSNMHVVGNKYVRRGAKYYYKHVSEQENLDTKIWPNTYGYLEHGFFDDIDAAIVRLNPAVVDNHIPGFGKPRGYIVLNFRNLNIFKRKDYFMYGATSQRKPTKLVNIGINKSINPYGNRIFLTDLIQVSKCAQKGDSGCPVFEPSSMRLLGITVGSDRNYTYLIPIKKILNRFNVEFNY